MKKFFLYIFLGAVIVLLVFYVVTAKEVQIPVRVVDRFTEYDNREHRTNYKVILMDSNGTLYDRESMELYYSVEKGDHITITEYTH